MEQAAGPVDWYLTDAVGSVREVVQGEVSGGAMTAEAVDHVIYTAYGAPTVEEGSMPRFGFDGMRFDAATGFDLTATRRYDPSTGTWIQPDPIGFLGGQDNLSEFVGNDPTNFVDPSGLGPISPWGDRASGDLPPGAQWWANGPNDIPTGMVWVYPGFGQYSSGGAYVPYYGCDCCEGGGYDNPSVAESLDPAGAFGPLGPGYPSGYEFGGGGIGGGDSGTAGMVSPIEIVDSSHENRSFIGASGQTAWGLPPPPPPPPVLSDNEATVLNMALAAGSSASQQQFDEAERFVNQVNGGNSYNAMRMIVLLRGKNVAPWDNQLLASLEHYFYMRRDKEGGCGLPAGFLFLKNTGYIVYKWTGLPFPNQDAKPYSPPSLLQWQAGNWGINDGVERNY